MRKKMYQGLISGRSPVKSQDPVPSRKANTNRQRWQGLEFTQTEKHMCRLGCKRMFNPTVTAHFPSPPSFCLQAFSNLTSSPLIWELSDVGTGQRNGWYISYFGWSDQQSLAWDPALWTPHNLPLILTKHFVCIYFIWLWE